MEAETQTKLGENDGKFTENKCNKSNRNKLTSQPPMNRIATVWITNHNPIKKFSNDYTKLMQIGESGAFGTAYQCIRKSDGAKFAVKSISKARMYRLDSSHKYRKRLFNAYKNEIDIMRRLRHKYIVNQYETYETKHNINIVMEECKGGELFDRIRERGRYHELDAIPIIRMICEALFYMHDKHCVVHGDLKPDNILFVSRDENSYIKIIDFGMAKICQRLDLLNTLVGTPYYTAPEVINGHYSHAADMWSVGVIAYAMIFGCLPFSVKPGKYGPIGGINENKAIYKKIIQGFNPVVKKGYGPWFCKSLSDCLGKSGMDFIGGLLQMDVDKRLTAKEALQHPWLKDNIECAVDLEALEMHQFASFATAHKFKYAVSALFRQQYKNMRPEHLKNLRNLFTELDKDKNGKISYKEFEAGVMNKCEDFKLDADNIGEMFSELDINKEGEIEFKNLLDAAVYDYIVTSDARLYKAFHDLDQNDTGKISTHILKQKLCELNPYGGNILSIILQVIDEADLDKDGAIDYAEFLKVLHPDFNKTPNWFWDEKSDTSSSSDQEFEDNNEIINIDTRVSNAVHRYTIDSYTNGTAKQGYMLKQGKLIKSWRKRWFVLNNNGIMSYYQDKDSKQPIARFNVKHATKLMYKSWGKSNAKRYGIKIYTPLRKWRFVLRNNEERMEWMKAIERVCGKKIFFSWQQ